MLITKSEAKILNQKYEIPYKAEGGISTSSTNKYKKNRKYYLCSRKYNLDALNDIRKVIKN